MGARAGNTAQLQQMVKKGTGFDLKKGQVRTIISAKIGGVEQHLAHVCIIRSYMHALAKADADGRYTVEVAPLADSQVQFIQVFCCQSGGIRTFQHFDGSVLVDVATYRARCSRRPAARRCRSRVAKIC